MLVGDVHDDELHVLPDLARILRRGARNGGAGEADHVVDGGQAELLPVRVRDVGPEGRERGLVPSEARAEELARRRLVGHRVGRVLHDPHTEVDAELRQPREHRAGVRSDRAALVVRRARDVAHPDEVRLRVAQEVEVLAPGALAVAGLPERGAAREIRDGEPRRPGLVLELGLRRDRRDARPRGGRHPPRSCGRAPRGRGRSPCRSRTPPPAGRPEMPAAGMPLIAASAASRTARTSLAPVRFTRAVTTAGNPSQLWTVRPATSSVPVHGMPVPGRAAPRSR